MFRNLFSAKGRVQYNLWVYGAFVSYLEPDIYRVLSNVLQLFFDVRGLIGTFSCNSSVGNNAFVLLILQGEGVVKKGAQTSRHVG